ncbi:MAG: hypothetical protein IJN07_00040 [Clostridia bacterium]|nr:hypothetical protein [Clostridia bacterium]
MFGYVQMYKPELKMREYEQYRGVYCSLCKQLGRRYGAFLRLGLSYDLTFLALLSMALKPACVGFSQSRCSYNPMKKCLACESTGALEKAADITALMVYYRAQDTLEDEGFFKRLKVWLTMPFLRRYHKKAKALLPEIDRELSQMMRRQREVEAAKTASIDAAAEPFAMLLQYLCSELSTDERQQAVLSRLGYCLGRYVYLADAIADLREDGRRGRYNPFILNRRLNLNDTAAVEETERYAADVLRHCQAECIAAYNLLDIYHFDGILRNILQEGITAVVEKQKGVKKETV